MVCAPPAGWKPSQGASFLAQFSAASSAIGGAPREISTKSRRSPRRGRCGSFSVIRRLNVHDLLSRVASRAFAPLNGFVDDSPSKPRPPSQAKCKSLHDKAAKQLSIAADYITKCGYHGRDEELAELQAVRDGRRRFADLPLRV
jgi:hypothetical protein